MDATVIIPSYKSGKTIAQCLRSLLHQNTKYDYEIILVDSSSDNTVEDIAKKYSKVKFIKLKRKTCQGIARNIGADVATGELLMFIDADVVVSSNWVENAIKYYRAGHNVFAGSLCVEKRNKIEILEKAEWFFEVNEIKPSMKESIRWCLPACVLAVKKNIFQSAKFSFMETSEDVELTVRLREKGNILYFNPELQASHMFNPAFNKLIKKIFTFGSSNIQIRKIHKISGWSIVRKPVLCFFTIPGFALIKLAKISWRNLKYNNVFDRIFYILIFPLMIVLVLAWMVGCYKGLFDSQKD